MIHPQFLEIVKLVLDYRDNCSPDTRVEVYTNGYGKKVKRTLAVLPPGVEVENSAKHSNIQVHFETFNVAAIDLDDVGGFLKRVLDHGGMRRGGDPLRLLPLCCSGRY